MTKICKYCGEEFETNRNQQKYCSKRCQYKEYYKRNREKILKKNKKYREDHREHYIEYMKQYRLNHKKYYKEYYKQYREKGPKNSRLKFPCSRYVGDYIAQIPTKMCLNCSAPECRFYND